MQKAETITISKAEYDLLTLKSEQYDSVKLQLEWLRKQLFGRKSERFVPATTDGKSQQLEFDFGGETLSVEAQQTIGQAIAAHERRKPQEKKPHPGRMPIPEHLRREEVVIEPEEDTTGMVRIGEDVTEVLEYTPAEVWVKRIVRPKYARPAKEQQEGLKNIIQAAAPDTPLNRSKAGVSLIAHILIAKYLEHLPLDRLLHRFARSGLKIPQQTIGNWVKNGLNLLKILYDAYGIWLLDADYLQMDETIIKVLEDGKGKTHQGYYWVINDPVHRAPYFYYHPGRDHGLPLKLLNKFKGILQCDGYGAYEALQKLRPDTIRLVNCLSHIRRDFFDAQGNDAKHSEEALAIIRQMYAVEEEARVQQLTHAQRLALRQEKLKPLFELFKIWLDTNAKKVTPSSTIGKAIAYALNRWSNMQIVLQDGSVEIDNNLVENVIRVIALGRKNYLFAGSHDAAQRAAAAYSFFAACKNHGINPEVWLLDVLNRIQDTKVADLHILFPQNWKPISK